MRGGTLRIIIIAGVVGVMVFGLIAWRMPGKDSEQVTTPEAAATAGATVSPTEPPLRVEPK